MLTRYQMQREIGRGGMGVVYATWDTVSGRTMALKTVQLPLAGTIRGRYPSVDIHPDPNRGLPRYKRFGGGSRIPDVDPSRSHGVDWPFSKIYALRIVSSL